MPHGGSIGKVETKFSIQKASKEDLKGIRNLQLENYRDNVSDTDKSQEGFVSLQSSEKMLEEISKRIGVLVAKDKAGNVIGYEFPIAVEYSEENKFLDPFIDYIKSKVYHNVQLDENNTIIAGQICVKKRHKGQGIVSELHKRFKKMVKDAGYKVIISEVSSKNPRSLHASQKYMGLEVIEKYEADGAEWYVVAQEV